MKPRTLNCYLVQRGERWIAVLAQPSPVFTSPSKATQAKAQRAAASWARVHVIGPHKLRFVKVYEA